MTLYSNRVCHWHAQGVASSPPRLRITNYNSGCFPILGLILSQVQKFKRTTFDLFREGKFKSVLFSFSF